MNNISASKLYVGCTIGPVVSTLNKAKTPVEIWMASYLFSRIAQEIVSYITNQKEVTVTMISPSEEGAEIANSVTGVGLYSDHIFFEIEGSIDRAEANQLVKEAKLSALNALAKDIAISCGKSEEPVADHVVALDKSIFVLYTIGDNSIYKTMPVHKMTEELDRLECYPPFVDRVDGDAKDLIEEYLISLEQHKSKWLESHKISAKMYNKLLQKSVVNESNDVELENYVVMVQADGDYMGKLLGTLSTSGEMKLLSEISTFLFNQGAANAEFVRSYGAMPIYFGGDDMLFLAPVRGKVGEKEGTILELIEQLGNRFDEAFETMKTQLNETQRAALEAAIAAVNAKPALSFGLAICYCKYPLAMIREIAADALFGGAKHTDWTGARGKKAVQIALRKHSGQTSNICLRSGEAGAFTYLVKMLHYKVSAVSLHALHWKIMEQRNAVAYLLMLNNKAQRKERLLAWLKQNFNEVLSSKVDHDSSADMLLGEIEEFLCAIADELWDGSEKPLKPDEAKAKIMSNIDGAFRLLEFMEVKDKSDKKEDKQ